MTNKWNNIRFYIGKILFYSHIEFVLASTLYIPVTILK